MVPRCPVSRSQSPQFWWSRVVRSRVFSCPVLQVADKASCWRSFRYSPRHTRQSSFVNRSVVRCFWRLSSRQAAQSDGSAAHRLHALSSSHANRPQRICLIMHVRFCWGVQQRLGRSECSPCIAILSATVLVSVNSLSFSAYLEFK